MLMARKRLHCWMAIKIQFKFRARILITATERNYQDCYHSLLRLGIINRPRWGFLIVGKFSSFFSHGVFQVLSPRAATNIKAALFWAWRKDEKKECGSQKNGSNISLSSLLPPSQLSLCDYVMLSHENVKELREKRSFPDDDAREMNKYPINTHTIFCRKSYLLSATSKLPFIVLFTHRASFPHFTANDFFYWFSPFKGKII